MNRRTFLFRMTVAALATGLSRNLQSFPISDPIVDPETGLRGYGRLPIYFKCRYDKEDTKFEFCSSIPYEVVRPRGGNFLIRIPETESSQIEIEYLEDRYAVLTGIQIGVPKELKWLAQDERIWMGCKDGETLLYPARDCVSTYVRFNDAGLATIGAP